MNWLADSAYAFADNPAAACLARTAEEQQGRRQCLRLLRAALPAQGDMFPRAKSRREQLLSDAAADLERDIAAVDAEVAMATGEAI